MDPKEMRQCQGPTCGYIYNPEKGDKKGKIPRDVKFNELPEEWQCPVCGARKRMFKAIS